MKKPIKQYYETAVDSTLDGIYFVDRRRKILYWNKNAEEITGYTPKEMVNRRCYDNILQHVDEKGTLLCKANCPLVRAVKSGKVVKEPVFLHDKNGARIPVEVEAIPVRNRKGEITGAVERFNQGWGLSLIRENIQQLQKDAFIDHLTQIPNRRYLEMKQKEGLEEAKKLHKNLAVLFIDIDHFKNINDTYGHEIGDKVLRAVAQTLLSNVKPIDVVGRFGGEEFVIILKDIAEENLKRFAETLRILVSKSSVGLDEGEISPTVSIGGTLLKEDDTTESVIERADSLMYQAKLAGRNTTKIG